MTLARAISRNYLCHASHHDPSNNMSCRRLLVRPALLLVASTLACGFLIEWWAYGVDRANPKPNLETGVTFELYNGGKVEMRGNWIPIQE